MKKQTKLKEIARTNCLCCFCKCELGWWLEVDFYTHANWKKIGSKNRLENEVSIIIMKAKYIKHHGTFMKGLGWLRWW